MYTYVATQIKFYLCLLMLQHNSLLLTTYHLTLIANSYVHNNNSYVPDRMVVINIASSPLPRELVATTVKV